jgi:hypothetical protein
VDLHRAVARRTPISVLLTEEVLHDPLWSQFRVDRRPTVPDRRIRHGYHEILTDRGVPIEVPVEFLGRIEQPVVVAVEVITQPIGIAVT